MVIFKHILEQNLIYIIFALVVLLAVALYIRIIRNHFDLNKSSSEIFFTKSEYKKFKKDGDRAITNTTISFNQNNVGDVCTNDLYLTTISMGTQVLRESMFSISKTGDI